MSDEEMRIAIAESVGWEDLRRPSGIMRAPKGHDLEYDYPPDYLNDLNAMHEAECVLTEYQRILYLDHLTPKFTHIKDRDWTAFHATARQRAEAFLRTVGKWKD